MTTSPISGTTAAQTPSAPAATTSATDPLANQDVFLQLLVAQLKYQDPENPADGTAFVTQLAQFTSLSEQTQSRTDLDGILKDVTPAAPTGTTATTNN